MSECTLYILDAPRIKTPEGAARQVEKSQAAEVTAATARLLGFFDELLLMFPDDGSESSVWYEGFAHNRRAGSVFALVFRLERLDAALLQRLRELAGRHRLHVFDPEGFVLYLNDGSEAIRMDRPPPFPQPGAAPCSSGLRVDGVYELKMSSGYNYFCFTHDGRVLSQSISGRVAAKRVLQLMYECDAFVAKGPCKHGERSFTGSMKAAYGSFKLDGTLAADGSVTITSQKTRGPRHTGVYTFIPL